MTMLRWILPLSFVAACAPQTDDHVHAVAMTSERMVVTGSTTTESGSCLHGSSTRRGGLLFVSGDRGGSFDRYEIAGERAIDAIAVQGDEFFVLISSADGFAVDASTDGLAWTRRTSGSGDAHDLIVDATGLHVAHDGGVRSSPDGVTWTDHRVDGGGLYAPRLTRAGGRFVLATGDGALSTSTDGASWTPHAIASITSVHRLASAGGRAIAIAHAERDGGDGSYLVAFDPGTDAPATFAAIDDGVMAVVDAPAGILIGDGTLAAGGDLTTRTPHSGPFIAGAVSGDRVVLADEGGLALSTDGGATFPTRTELPVF